MASLTYRQHYADGTSKIVRRSTPQGRHALPKELKSVRVNISINPVSLRIIKEKAKKLNMPVSAYIELSGILYTPELLKS